jgi:hypothetical protein
LHLTNVPCSGGPGRCLRALHFTSAVRALTGSWLLLLLVRGNW